MSFFDFFEKERSVPLHPKEEPLFDPPPEAEALAAELGDSGDVGRRDIKLFDGTAASLFFIDGLVDSVQLGQDVLRPVMRPRPDVLRRRDIVTYICESVSPNLTVKTCGKLSQAVELVLQGWTVMCVGDKALAFEAKGGETRSVTEPSVENVVKGSKDAFVETLRTNTALLRRKLRNKNLRFTERTLGRQSGTKVSVVTIEGLTNPALLKDIEKRLDAVDTDGLLTPAAVEEHIVRSCVDTVFPMLSYTDLVDVFAEGVMEGRAGLLVDGLPVGYLMPATAEDFMTAPEDAGNNHIVASIIRFLRYVALIVTLLLPGFYVAVATFHQEMIPYKLARAIVASKQSVPFSTTVEVIGMLIAFEILQEAGLRLPKSIGQTVSIVGALIVGQSAVEAKIFSPVVVIIVAIAGVAGYTIPNQDFASAIRVWRFVVAAAGAVFGMLGVAGAGMVLTYHMCTIETFGVDYMTGIAGGRSNVARRPFTEKKLRREDVKPVNVRREGR